MHVAIDITAGPARGQHLTFDEPDRFLFGRSADARVSLPKDPYVSRHHFLLEISPPNCKITDLDSKNGVFVNGVRFGGRKPLSPGAQQAPNNVQSTYLKDGDEIVVGETRMKVIIQTDIFCVKCGRKLALDKEEEYTCIGSTYLCTHCEPKRATKGTSRRKVTTSSYTFEPGRRKVSCVQCGQDVTDEAGLRGQQAKVEYVCNACREKEGNEPLELLEEMLNAAVAEKGLAPAPLGAPTIRGYHIEKELARGGMGVVYKAIEIQTVRPVAIKTMLPHVAINPNSVRIFQREIELTRQLNHRNIVRLLDHGKIRGMFYFVLEFVEGTDLYQLTTSHGGRLSLQDALPILLDTLDGLAYAHQTTVTIKLSEQETKSFSGIVHRDLKPQNILLTRSGGEQWLPKIADFGTAKSFESAGFTDITVPGDVLGTPMYWPREQITHYKYLNPATDVFSIAAVFYEILTGRWVRDGFEEMFETYRQNKRSPSISDYMKVIVDNLPVPIRDRNPDIPEPIARVFDRALQEVEVPHDEVKMRETLSQVRYPHAGAFRESLLNAIEEIRESELKQATAPVRAAAVVAQQQPVLPKKEATTDRQTALPGAIMYPMKHTSSSREVAMLVLDLEHSSEYIHEVGDTYFSNLIGTIYRHVKDHPLASSLIFMKTTGDGFLAVFQTVQVAFSIALEFLKMPIHQDISVRIALHWGTVKTGPAGDVLGAEVHRVFRVEGVQEPDRAESTTKDFLPPSGRLLVTRPAYEQLGDFSQARFRFVGTFRLKGFEEPEDLWIISQ